MAVYESEYKGSEIDERLAAMATLQATVAALQSAVDELNEKIGNIEYTEIHYDVDDVTWETGGVKGSDGTNMSTSSSMKRTNYIDVSGLKTITFMGTQSNTRGEQYGYAFYDANQGYISGSRWDEDLTAPAEIKKVYTVEVPATAKYFRTCRYVPVVGNDWYLDSRKIDTVADSLASLDSRVTALEAR